MVRHAALALAVLLAAPAFAYSGVRSAGRPGYTAPVTKPRSPPSATPLQYGYHPGGGYVAPAPGYSYRGNGYGYAPSPGFTTTRYAPGAAPRSSYGYAGGYNGYHRYGYYSGGYVPRYGYGYSYYYAPAPVVVAGGYEVAAPAPVVVEEEVGVRVTAGVEGMGFKGDQGFGGTMGVNLMVEGARWGFAVTAADIMTPVGNGDLNHLGDVTAHLTFAFLTGRYGRMRAELGADGFFGPHTIMVGPTGGLSGVIWLGGPVGIEASVMATPWPYLQLDGKLGLAVGIDRFGLRAGWRVQALNDRGIVDGTEHSELITGPYVGMSIVF
jgi:hypothetical protein